MKLLTFCKHLTYISKQHNIFFYILVEYLNLFLVHKNSQIIYCLSLLYLTIITFKKIFKFEILKLCFNKKLKNSIN